jgi:hypothetical protein
MFMDFEALMQQGQQAHRQQDFDTALSLRLAAHEVAADDMTMGRAARDVAASLDRLNYTESAIEWADRAWELHNNAVETAVPNALRERAASAMCCGGLALREAIQKEQAGTGHQPDSMRARFGLKLALNDILGFEENTGLGIDQYRINITGRAALSEALYGKRRRAISLGTIAVGFAFITESQGVAIPSATPLPASERLKAGIRSAARGVGAITVAALSYRPTRSTALRLANKLL